VARRQAPAPAGTDPRRVAEEAVEVIYEFATPEAPRLRGGIAAGRVEIETADTQTSVVEVEALRGNLENLKVEQHGREIVVEQRKKLGLRGDEFLIRITAPHGLDVDFNVASADLRARGQLGSLETNSASGDVTVEEVARNAKVRAASGDVHIERVAGAVDVNTASGDVAIGSAAGGASVRSASGDVRIGEAAKRVSINTASGDQLVERFAQGTVDVKSASGDVVVGVQQGSRLFVDARSLSGETSSEMALDGVETETDGPLVEIKAATMSGDIRIVRA
jgi:DUF4097 and DUF4098 domain-containing protein YvlB